MAARHGDAHMGPFPLPQGGTLTSAQRQDIWQRTGVSACVRWRAQWQQRCLTLSGPADWLMEGKRLAEAAIQANGSEHGRQEEDQPAQTHDVDELRRRFDWLHQYYHGQIATLQNQLDQVSRRASEAYDKAVELTEILEKQKQEKKDKKRKRTEKKKEQNEEQDEERSRDGGPGSASHAHVEKKSEGSPRRDVRDPKQGQEEKNAPKQEGGKTTRGPSPGPTEDQLKNIPWFKELYDFKVAAAKDEKWIKSKTQYVAKGLEGNAGKEYEYYKRECSAYGVTRSDEVPTVIPVDDNEAEEKQAASSQGGLPLTKIPETQEEPLK